MATVPRVDGATVQEQAPNFRLDRQDIAAPAAAFGAVQARDLGQLGQQVDQLAQQIETRQAADQSFQADTALKQDYLQFQQNIDKRKGVNAYGVTADTTKFFDDSIQKYSQGLDPRAQRLFLQSAQTLRLSGILHAGQYENKEREQSVVDSANARISTTIGVAAAKPTPDNVAQAQSTIDKTIRAVGAMNGWDKDLTEKNRLDQMGQLHLQVLQGLIENQPLQAQAYLDAHKNEIPGTALAEVEHKVTVGTAKETAQAFADQAVKGMNEEQAIKTVRDKYAGDLEDIYVSAVRSRFADVRTAQADADKATMNQAYGLVADAVQKGKTLTIGDIPNGLLTKLSGSQRLQLFGEIDRVNNNTKVSTDFGTYDKLTKMFQNDPENFHKVDLTQYFPQLADSDRRHFEDLSTASAQAVTNGSKLKDVQDLSGQISTSMGVLGLDGNDGQKPQLRAAITQAINERISAEEQKTQKPLNYLQRQQIINEMIVPGPGTAFDKALKSATAPKINVSIDQVLSDAHDTLGLTGKDPAGSKAVDRGVFDTTFKDQLNKLQLQAGRELTYDEQSKLVKKLSLPGKFMGNKAARLYEVIGTPDETNWTVDIPDADKKALTKAFAAKGVSAPSDQQLLRAYLKAKGIE
jgi:hypothetical protein